MVAPTPTAAPFTAAMIGFLLAYIRSVTTPPASRYSSTDGPPFASTSKVDDPPPRSIPAQNARPRPVMTTARTASSASDWSNASQSSWPIRDVNAFSRSGRSSVIVRMPSSTA